MNSREVLKALEADGWYRVAQVGSHVQYRHPRKKGRVTVVHPKKDIPIGTLRFDRETVRRDTEVTMRHYIALLRKEPTSDYGVDFPDFPGCVTAGFTLEEARRMAAEALSLHIGGMVADGAALPEPSDLDTVMSDPHNRDAVAFLVAAPTSDKSVRVNVTFAQSLLDTIDTRARALGYSRSAFLAMAARTFVEGHDA